jgi:hypothetical protein
LIATGTQRASIFFDVTAGSERLRASLPVPDTGDPEKDSHRRLVTGKDGRLMNLRVFVLIAAMAAFGALWSSDGRYQAEQLAIVRAERARATNVAFVTRLGRVVGIPTVNRTAKPATSVTQDASEISPTRAVLTLQALLAAEKTQPSLDRTANEIVAQVSVERLAIVGILGVDPGNGVAQVSASVDLVKTQLEERFCLLRFHTRQTGYFASRRMVAFVRAISIDPQATDGGRIATREVPIKASQAPVTGGRQTR